MRAVTWLHLSTFWVMIYLTEKLLRKTERVEKIHIFEGLQKYRERRTVIEARSPLLSTFQQNVTLF